jgi:TRAP-type C4-dicarboxylate transport system permease small subunit
VSDDTAWRERWVGRLGTPPALLILGMAAVTTIDVIGRYIFGRPLGGAFEVTEIAMGLAIYAGLGLAALGRDHIRVDLAKGWLPPAVRRAQLVCGNLVCAVVAAALGWRVLTRGTALVEVGERFLVLGFPKGWIAWAMGALALAAAVAFLQQAWRLARGPLEPDFESSSL